ncbi:MAG: hypothetical protein QXG80_00150 [Nanopusillaceae archaeon]
MDIRKIIVIISSCLVLFTPISAETVLATTKITYADTILAKVVSEIFGYPQILLERDKLSNETINKLRELNITEILIIGGPAVVSFNVEKELIDLGYNVIRIWGVERFETSALVAKYFWENSEEAVLITEELANERANFRILSLVREAVEYSINNKVPLLITTPGNLEKNVLDALISLGVKRVKIFTITGNLGDIPEELESLNISYEIKREKLAKNCNVLRIGVPSDALWNLTQEILIYGRCIEIVPLENISEEYLKEQNISVIILNLSDVLKFRENFVYREMIEKRKKVMERLTNILKERIYDIFVDIILRLEDIPEEYKECYYKVASIINENKEDTYKEILNCLSEINKYRWNKEIFVKDFKKQQIDIIRENIARAYRKVFENLTSDKELIEERITIWMPDPLQIKEKLLELARLRIINRIREEKICAQVIVCACNPFGRCLEFPTPCNVPPLWRIVPCEELNRTGVRNNISAGR